MSVREGGEGARGGREEGLLAHAFPERKGGFEHDILFRSHLPQDTAYRSGSAGQPDPSQTSQRPHALRVGGMNG